MKNAGVPRYVPNNESDMASDALFVSSNRGVECPAISAGASKGRFSLLRGLRLLLIRYRLRRAERATQRPFDPISSLRIDRALLDLERLRNRQ